MDINRRGRRKKNEEIKEQVEVVEKLMIAKIDNIFMIFEKNEPAYFGRLKLITCLVILSVTNGFLGMIISMTKPKNNTYCFDFFSSEFKICNSARTCTNRKRNDINKILYIDEKFNDQTIANIDVKKEIIEINRYFSHFFFKENYLYLRNNQNYVNQFYKINEDYTAMIQITYKENFNIVSYFGLLCEYSTIFTYFLVFSTIGIVIGSFVLPYLGDLFGRKFLLLFSLCFNFLGSLGYFLFFMFTTIGMNSIEYSDLNHEIFKENTDTIYKIDLEYRQLYFAINQLHQEKVDLGNIFIKQIFLFNINHLFNGISMIGSSVAITSLIIENATSNMRIFSNYLYLFYGLYLGFGMAFLSITFINSPQYIYLIQLIISLLTFLICLFFVKESPKFLFEHKRYKDITKFFESIMDRKIKKRKEPKNEKEALKQKEEIEEYEKQIEKLDKIYTLTSNAKVKKELSRKSINIENDDDRKNRFGDFKYQSNDKKGCSYFISKTTLLDYCTIRETVRESLSNIYGRVEIDLDFIIQHPLILMFLTFNNPRLANKFLVLYSLIICTLIIYFVLVGMMLNSILFSRHQSYENFAYNSYNIYIGILCYISTQIFNFFFKYFGVKIILVICYFFIFFLSLIFSAIGDGTDFFFNRNIYYYNQTELIYSRNFKNYVNLYFFMIFFTSGAFHCLLLHFTKYTYTINRCTAYGIFYFMFGLIILFTQTINYFFNDTIPYLIICSMVGFVNCLFFNPDDNKSYVNEYRDIKLDDINT